MLSRDSTTPSAAGDDTDRPSGKDLHTLITRWNALPMLVRHCLAAVAALLVIVLATTATDQLTDIRIASIGLYMVALAGLSILVGYSGQISLGHGAFMFVGAYTTALLIIHVPEIPLWLNILLAIAVSCVAGLIVGAATSRLHGPYLAGATLALALGLPQLAVRFPEFLGGHIGLSFQTRGTPEFLADIMPNTQWQALVVWFTALLAMIVLANISKGRLGRQLRAIRDDETAAAMSGIQVGRTKVVAFIISAGCGGLAGSLQAYVLGTANPDSFEIVLSLSLLAVLVFGGLGSLWGAFWAAIAIVYIEVWGDELRRTFDLPTDIANNLPLVLYGLLLILVIRIWPGGIQGALRSARNWVRSRS